MVDYIIRPATAADYIGILVVQYNLLQTSREGDAILDRIVELQIDHALTAEERAMVAETHIAIGSNQDILGYITVGPPIECRVLPTRHESGIERRLMAIVNKFTPI